MRGMKIIENPNMLVPEERVVDRTAKERWLTRPWRPWQKTKVITVYVPDNHVLLVKNPFTGERDAVCHPEVADVLRARLAESDNDYSRTDPWRH